MRNVAIAFIALLSLLKLEALPVGNPMDPQLYCNHLIVERSDEGS